MPAHNSNEAQVHSHKNHYSSLPLAAEYGWQEKK